MQLQALKMIIKELVCYEEFKSRVFNFHIMNLRVVLFPLSLIMMSYHGDFVRGNGLKSDILDQILQKYIPNSIFMTLF